MRRSALALCLLAASPLPAAPLQGPDAVDEVQLPPVVKERCDRFFKLLGEDRCEDAFNFLFQGSALASDPDIQKQMPALIAQVHEANRKGGRVHGYEPYYTRSIGSRFFQAKCLAYHEQFPMEWVLTFYESPTSGWILKAFRLKDASLSDSD